MTREVAIEIFKRLKENAPNEMHLETVGTAQELFDMAIQALSQEPCTDAVSREAVIYYIKGHIHEIITESGTDKNAHTNSILRALINGVETMPSVTHRSGKWIRWREEVQRGTHYTENIPHCKCSECDTEYDIFASRFINYCPNCGCRMVEPQERSDKE